MADLQPLVQKLVLDASGYEVTASRAGAVVNRLKRDFDAAAGGARNAETAMHALMGSFKSAVITLGALRFALMDLDDFLLAFPKSVARVGGEFQKMQTLMEGLSKSTDETVRKMEGLRDMSAVLSFAKTAPFEISALSDAFVKLKASGLDPTAGGMSALVNSVAKFGGSSETLKRAAVAIQQMSGKGVISMEELRQQLGEAVPNAMELMARGLNLTVAELTDKVSKGIVKSSTALARMFAQMELDARGAAERMTQTLPGAIAKLKTEFELFQKTVGDQGFTTTVTSFIGEISAFLQSDEGRNFAKSLGTGLRDLLESLISMSRWLGNNIDLLKNMGLALVSLYGGSKAAGAYQGVRGMLEGQRQAQKQLFDEAEAGRRKELESLKKKAGELERQRAIAMRSAQEARTQAANQIGAELERFNAYKQKQLEGLEQIRQAKRSEHLEQLQRLRQLEAQQRSMRADAVLSGLLRGEQVTAQGVNRQVNGPANGAALMRARSIEEEIRLSKSLLEQKAKEVIATDGLIAAKSRERMAATANFGAVDAEVRKINEAINKNNEMIASKSRLSTVASSAGGAIAGFARSLAGGLGWAALFFGAVEGLVWIFNRFTQAAREAEEQQYRFERARKGQSTDDDPEKFTAQIGDLRSQINTLQADRRRAVAGLTRTGGESFRQEIAKIDSQIAGLTARIKQASGLSDLASKTVNTRTALNTAQSILSDIENQVNAELNSTDIFKRYQAKVLEQSKATDEKTRKKLGDDLTKMGLELRNAEIASWEKISKARISGIDKADKAVLDAVTNGSTQKLAALLKQRDLMTTSETTVGAKKPQKEDWIVGFMRSRAQQLADLKGDAEAIADGYITAEELYSQAIEKVNAAARANRDGSPISARQFEAAVEAQFDVEKYAVAKKAVTEFSKAITDMQGEQARAAEALGSTSLKGPVAEAEKLITKLEPVRDILKKTGFDFDEFAAKLRRAAAAASGDTFLLDMNNQLIQLADELETDEVARERRKTDAKIYEINKRLDAEITYYAKLGVLSEQDLARRDQIISKANDLKASLEKAFDLKTRSPIAKMAEDWSKGMRSMQQASVSWANDFVDRLVEGNLKFGEFVQNILKDIAKIKIKEVLSDSIGGVLDGAVNAIGGFIGLKPNTGKTMKYDPVSGALLVKNVDQVGGTANGIDMAANGITSIWDSIKNGMSSLWTKLSEGLSALWNGISGMFSGGGAGGGGGGWLATLASFFFADGGVLGKSGPLSLKKYAAGGVANSPQVAVFGEAGPEAFVPLPDGRRIPVAMQGGGGGGGAAPSVTMNFINQTGTQMQAEQRGMKWDGRQMVLDVVLTGMSQPGAFRDNMRNTMGAR